MTQLEFLIIPVATFKTKDSVGDITMLVNNAGIVTGKKFLECDDRLIEKTFQVNTISHFWVCRLILFYLLFNFKCFISIL